MATMLVEHANQRTHYCSIPVKLNLYTIDFYPLRLKIIIYNKSTQQASHFYLGNEIRFGNIVNKINNFTKCVQLIGIS